MENERGDINPKKIYYGEKFTADMREKFPDADQLHQMLKMGMPEVGSRLKVQVEGEEEGSRERGELSRLLSDWEKIAAQAGLDAKRYLSFGESEAIS